VRYPKELHLFEKVPAALEPLRGLAPATERMNDARFIDWVIATAYDHASPVHAQVVKTIEPVLTAFYPSQFFQAFAEGPCLLILMALAWLAPRKAGVIGAVFLAGYGALRFATEQFREADSPVIAFGFLTLPMLLSIVMIAAGALVFALSRRSQPIGGLVWKTATGQPDRR
jgi:prolipoprotein diacylglyceryltransferase